MIGSGAKLVQPAKRPRRRSTSSPARCSNAMSATSRRPTPSTTKARSVPTHRPEHRSHPEVTSLEDVHAPTPHPIPTQRIHQSGRTLQQSRSFCSCKDAVFGWFQLKNGLPRERHEVAPGAAICQPYLGPYTHKSLISILIDYREKHQDTNITSVIRLPLDRPRPRHQQEHRRGHRQTPLGEPLDIMN